MEEQLISFETAKLAKEKGFNEIPCHYVYDEGILKQSYQAFNRLNFELAPTQSLLQKWLRDKHNINVLFNTYHVGEPIKGVSYGCYIIDNIKGRLSSNLAHYTIYEEALEKGLQEALKLI